MLLEFGSVSNCNTLFVRYTMCYLLRVLEHVHTALHVKKKKKKIYDL